jgi:superfamily II DNA or RNA helicase
MLSINGYSLLKTSLKDGELVKIKEELTMKPRVNFELTAKKDSDNTFILYRETENRIYIPRYYGLCNYGLPKLSKITGGEDIDVEFNGKLREYQLEPVNKFLEAARNPLKMGGIISVPCGFGKTIMGLYIACQLKKKTMFISHKDFLNQQFIDTVKAFSPNANIGIIKQNKVDVVNKDFIIASLQSLSMRDYDINILAHKYFVVHSKNYIHLLY